MLITNAQLRHAFKHAKDFGIQQDANKQTLTEFAAKIEAHIASPGTRAIKGLYRGRDAIHFLDLSTGLNVIVDSEGRFLSGWKLSQQQLQHVLTSGTLGGAP